METTIANRIKELRNCYNMGVKEFANRCGLSHVAVFHFEGGKTQRPHRASLNKIISTYGTTAEWLLHGQGDMLPNGARNFYAVSEIEANGFWKDEAYQELKHKNTLLEKEVERLWRMMNHFTGNGMKTDLKVSGY
ncbi:MAG: helix-turn-helix transcriptional regulator [Bacteroidetes bacterium]|nr:helix-turn-helix transcriptional regulator [Bacteroidota bacterium]